MPDLSQRLTAALADRYRIERELGRGGMATVFLAEDLKHHRRVAIKVLDPEVAAAIGPERFLREIETVARLTHPHILPLHDSGVADGLLFYVMPYVEGESLRARLEREKQLPIDDALRIAREVADALSCAHSRGIVHRDIKPENILLEEGHAVVADFGIARAVAAGADKLTATGIAVGTPAYMSPEQTAGSRELDGRSDLYSLGCVLYEMLAGQPPFTGPTAESLAHQHLNVTPRPVTELRPAVPAGVAAALQRALAKTPADRFNPVALFGEALGSTAAERVSAPARRARLVTGLLVAALALATIATAWLARGRRMPIPAPAPPAVHARTEIAVLPFQNLSADGPNAYFAGGLHEELLTQLAKVAALKVISRTSVMGYANTSRPMRQIAAELGVGSIVEGSVQVAGERLRVNVQLIDAATDEHLWAERYDRTLADAFAIQSEVAQRIVEAVGARLASGEQQAIAGAPTGNAEAYRLYLQGEEYYRRPGTLRENMDAAQQLFERALALDPRFALARAGLSLSLGMLYWTRYEPSASTAERQFREAESALRQSPDLPQAHAAMGDAYYRVRRDYRRALEQYRIALRGLPGDAGLWYFVGAVNRRLGRWAAVDSAYREARRLDPRNADVLFDLGGQTSAFLRRFPEAMERFDQAQALAPDVHEIRVLKGWTWLLWTGSADSIHAAVDPLSESTDLGAMGDAEAVRAQVWLYERRSNRLLALARAAPRRVLAGQLTIMPAVLCAGWAHRLLGDEKAARPAFEEALAMLDSIERALPGDPRVHATRGWAAAALGRRADALRELRWIERSAVYRDDRLDGLALVEDHARILVQLRQADAALPEIERLLSAPSWTTVHVLRLDPRWDPIRGDPRFQSLLAKYADPGKWAVD